MRSYKDLIFWKRAFEVTKLCIKLVKKLPKERIAYIINDQLLRSSASIGALIAEGYARYGTKEYIRYLRMSLGSANEAEYWLLVLKDTYPRLTDETDNILDKNTETIKMLTSSINKLRKS